MICGLENNYACKLISDNFPGITCMSAFLGNCQKSVCMYCCSSIQGTRSLKISNLWEKSVPYFLEEQDQGDQGRSPGF